MNPIRCWNAFWFGPISARPLGVFRIVFGLIGLANLALLVPDMDYWLSGAGLMQGSEARELAGPLRFSILQYYQDPAIVHLVVGATAVAAALLTIGWHTRLMSALFYLGMVTIHNRNIETNCGPDILLLVMAFFLMLSPCGAAYSLDARRAARRRGTLAEPLIVPWAQRLIQLQLCLIYFITAILKAHGNHWLDGTAIHYVLNNPEVGRFRLDPLSQYPLIINILSYGALFFEFALPFWLWFRAIRPWIILAGVGLHFGVLLTVNVPLFGEMMTACYLTFLTPQELDVFLGWLRRLDPRTWAGSRGRRGRLPGRVDGPHDLAGWHQLHFPWEAGRASHSAAVSGQTEL